MSDRIVSWRINEPRVSPSLSTVSSASGLSVLSINSIVSDTHMITTEATGAQRVDLGATKLTNLTQSANPTSDDSFVRHDIYFFKDGNITFLIDGTLYCVHRYFFCRDSAYFSTKLGQLDARNHEPLNTIISLGDVERKDFEAFLSVIYPENFEGHDLSYEQWKSVLHLSTRWGFASLRKLALNSIKPPTPFDRLLLARTYSVDHRVLPALSALCRRKGPTSLKEAHQMSIEDIVVVATVREEIRSQRPFVDTAGLERRIEAAQVKVVAHVASDDEAAEEELPNVAVTSTSTKEVASAGTPSAVDMHGGDEHSDSSAMLPQKPEKKKKERKKGKKKGCQRNLGENTRANVAKSEAIADEGEAEHVVDTIPKEGEKGQARPPPSGLFGLPADTPSSQPVAQTTDQGLFGLPENPPSSQPVTRATGQGLFGLPEGTPFTQTTGQSLFGGTFSGFGSTAGWGSVTGVTNSGSDPK